MDSLCSRNRAITLVYATIYFNLCNVLTLTFGVAFHSPIKFFMQVLRVLVILHIPSTPVSLLKTLRHRFSCSQYRLCTVLQSWAFFFCLWAAGDYINSLVRSSHALRHVPSDLGCCDGQQELLDSASYGLLVGRDCHLLGIFCSVLLTQYIHLKYDKK